MSAVTPLQPVEKVAEKTLPQNYTPEQIATLRATVAKGANDWEFNLFLEVCRSKRLDPFSRQVHWSAQIKAVIVAIDGMRAIAERTGNYVPGPTRYETTEKGHLVAAHVTVRKRVGDRWFDVEESAYFDEYSGSSPIWRKMPRVMLAKCAESRALRRAFPDDISGLYSEEEVSRTTEIDEAPPKAERSTKVAEKQSTPRDTLIGRAEQAPDAPSGAALASQVDEARSKSERSTKAPAAVDVAALRKSIEAAADEVALKAAIKSIDAAKAGIEKPVLDELGQLARSRKAELKGPPAQKPAEQPAPPPTPPVVPPHMQRQPPAPAATADVPF